MRMFTVCGHLLTLHGRPLRDGENTGRVTSAWMGTACVCAGGSLPILSWIWHVQPALGRLAEGVHWFAEESEVGVSELEVRLPYPGTVSAVCVWLISLWSLAVCCRRRSWWLWRHVTAEECAGNVAISPTPEKCNQEDSYLGHVAPKTQLPRPAGFIPAANEFSNLCQQRKHCTALKSLTLILPSVRSDSRMMGFWTFLSLRRSQMRTVQAGVLIWPWFWDLSLWVSIIR